MLFSFAVVKPLALAFWLHDSAACQPMAVAYGIESSETLVVTEQAVPLAPLAGESENLNHSALLLICFAFERQEEGQRGCQSVARHRIQATYSFVWK